MPMKELDLVCFSHLRWNFVFQRPQHLLTRFSSQRRVFYVEEPVFGAGNDYYEVTQALENLWVVVPHLTNGGTGTEKLQRQEEMLHRFFADQKIDKYIFWYYTPMSLQIAHSFSPELVVYD